jgi:hypothetical protein
VYETVVTVDQDVDQLKPGMTAVVEIHVDRLVDVISIPVQAVVQIQKQVWCYVDQQGTPVRVPLKLGRSNEKFVEILEGLEEGQRVVLNPMAIFDESKERDERRGRGGRSRWRPGKRHPAAPAHRRSRANWGASRGAWRRASGPEPAPQPPAGKPGGKPRADGPPKTATQVD